MVPGFTERERQSAERRRREWLTEAAKSRASPGPGIGPPRQRSWTAPLQPSRLMTRLRDLGEAVVQTLTRALTPAPNRTPVE